jgi:hypothetical protein
VARRRAARRTDRGGDGVPAPRQARARLGLTAAVAFGAGALGAYAALDAERLGALLGAGGAAATVALVFASLLRRPRLAVGGLVLLGAEYAGYFLVRGATVDQRAPIYGAAFLGVAELTFTAMERRAPGSPELALFRVIAIAGLAVAAVALGTLVLAFAAIPAGGGVALHAVGVVAAVGLVLLLGRIALRSS